MRALFAAMQLGVALRAGTSEFGSGREGCCAVETTGRSYVLHQTGQPGTGHVDRRAGALRLGTLVARAFGVAVGIHVPVLSVLAIAVHGERVLRS